MEQTAAARFDGVYALAAKDPGYHQLQRQLAAMDLPFLEVLEKLNPEDRAVVREYVRLLGTSALRLTEIACENMT